MPSAYPCEEFLYASLPERKVDLLDAISCESRGIHMAMCVYFRNVQWIFWMGGDDVEATGFMGILRFFSRVV